MRGNGNGLVINHRQYPDISVDGRPRKSIRQCSLVRWLHAVFFRCSCCLLWVRRVFETSTILDLRNLYLTRLAPAALNITLLRIWSASGQMSQPLQHELIHSAHRTGLTLLCRQSCVVQFDVFRERITDSQVCSGILTSVDARYRILWHGCTRDIVLPSDSPVFPTSPRAMLTTRYKTLIQDTLLSPSRRS